MLVERKDDRWPMGHNAAAAEENRATANTRQIAGAHGIMQ
jgi:hypothetical protein